MSSIRVDYIANISVNYLEKQDNNKFFNIIGIKVELVSGIINGEKYSGALDFSLTAQKLKNSSKIRYNQFGRKLIFNSTEIIEDLSR